MRYRTLGRTGLRVSEVGFGGAPAGIPHYIEAWDAGVAERAKVERALERALDLGLNYLDTAPGYGWGTGEEIYGAVIARRRVECVVATKTGARSRQRSANRSRPACGGCRPMIDVLQFHGGWYRRRRSARSSRRGGLETFRQLREEGKIRLPRFHRRGSQPGVYRLVDPALRPTADPLQPVEPADRRFHQSPGDRLRGEGAWSGIVTMRTLTSGIFQKLMRQCFPENGGHRLGAVPPELRPLQPDDRRRPGRDAPPRRGRPQQRRLRRPHPPPRPGSPPRPPLPAGLARPLPWRPAGYGRIRAGGFRTPFALSVRLPTMTIIDCSKQAKPPLVMEIVTDPEQIQPVAGTARALQPEHRVAAGARQRGVFPASRQTHLHRRAEVVRGRYRGVSSGGGRVQPTPG